MLYEAIVSAIGQIALAGGGGAVVAYALFRFLGKGWIENQFARNLETVKAELTTLSAKRLKMYDREHIVFPEMWAKLMKLDSSIGHSLASLREDVPLNKLSDESLAEWLTTSDFSDLDKKFLLDAADKESVYHTILDQRSFWKACSEGAEFRDYFQSNRIFLRLELKEKLDQLNSIVLQVLARRKVHAQLVSVSLDSSLHAEAAAIWSTKAKIVISEIEAIIQQRLFPPERDQKQKPRAEEQAKRL